MICIEFSDLPSSVCVPKPHPIQRDRIETFMFASFMWESYYVTPLYPRLMFVSHRKKRKKRIIVWSNVVVTCIYSEHNIELITLKKFLHKNYFSILCQFYVLSNSFTSFLGTWRYKNIVNMPWLQSAGK